MPITSSQIIEDSQQADGRRWVTEEHTAGTGKTYKVTYLAEATTDINTVMAARVAGMNQSLIDTEISKYLGRIEDGLNVIGLDYTETTQTYRALQFLKWAKDMVVIKNFQALRFAYLVIDPYTEIQINNLLAGTIFENKADKIKAWVLKIKAMDLAMIDGADAAGEV